MAANKNMRTQSLYKSKNVKLLYPELSFELVGLCFDTHNELGGFAKEKHYADTFERKLKAAGKSYKRELIIGITGNTADFFVEGKIILEFKAKRFLTIGDFTQTQRYLQATGAELGILVNFGSKYVQAERVVRINKTTHGRAALIRSHSQN
jgi:GxxExxY protein